MQGASTGSGDAHQYAVAVLWVLVFAAIALAGLVMVVCYAVWLAHKTADVLSELKMLAGLGSQLADLGAQVSPPATAPVPDDRRDLRASGGGLFR